MQVSGTDCVQECLRVPVTSPFSTNVATKGKAVVLVVVITGQCERFRRFIATLTCPAVGLGVLVAKNHLLRHQALGRAE